MKKDAVATLIIKTQKAKIESHTKHPAQNRMNTVKIMEITKEKPTHPRSNGHPSLRSAKYSCRTDISMI